MSEISALSPAAVWEIFDLICSIPHPSGHEAALADALKARAEKHGLSCRMDAAGNLRIDRAAAPGFEDVPRIIIQAHLDMVPVADDAGFDFLTMPVEPYIDGDVVRARGTTLGGDDGSGVAIAMALLCDETLKCGALSALFTVSEETGLLGATALDADMLEGKYLINLDCGPVGCATIGCAGGARQEFVMVPEWENAAEGEAFTVTLDGLPGGHSGDCIDKNRGNAIKSLAGFLLAQTQLQLCAFDSGKADNAIPHEARAVVICSGGVETLKSKAAVFAGILNSELRRKEVKINIEPCTRPEKQYTATFRNKLLTALALAPNGAFERDETLGIVKTSSNLAAVFSSAEKIRIRTSQRSLVDECREQASAMLEAHFAAFGAAGTVSSAYPGWEPRPDCKLVTTCRELWEKYSGNALKIEAIHAGLECGAFGYKNPELELISMGPGAPGCHTTKEYVKIENMKILYEFLLQLLCVLN